MNHNQNTLTSYNKHNGGNQGTLIANWWEERELQDATGVGRATQGEHVQKKRDALFTSTPQELQQAAVPVPSDDTHERTLGKRYNEFPDPENSQYGKGVNKADQLRKKGLKAEARDQFFFEQIKQELKDQEAEEEAARNARHFDTTTKAEFYKKDAAAAGNTVGRRVMKTQNGQPIGTDSRDYDLSVDQGFGERPQFLTDDQLRELLPKGESYLTQQPITFWTEKQNEGVFYMSKGNDQNPKGTFNINNQYLKTYTNYTHVKK